MSDATQSEVQGGDAQKDRGQRRRMIGMVTSNKMDQTITVEVQRLVRHPLYEKFMRRRTRLHAHDPENQCRIGDRVEVVETRPLSKLKRYRLVRVVQQAQD